MYVFLTLHHGGRLRLDTNDIVSYQEPAQDQSDDTTIRISVKSGQTFDVRQSFDEIKELVDNPKPKRVTKPHNPRKKSQ